MWSRTSTKRHRRGLKFNDLEQDIPDYASMPRIPRVPKPDLLTPRTLTYQMRRTVLPFYFDGPTPRSVRPQLANAESQYCIEDFGFSPRNNGNDIEEVVRPEDIELGRRLTEIVENWEHSEMAPAYIGNVVSPVVLDEGGIPVAKENVKLEADTVIFDRKLSRLYEKQLKLLDCYLEDSSTIKHVKEPAVSKPKKKKKRKPTKAGGQAGFNADDLDDLVCDYTIARPRITAAPTEEQPPVLNFEEEAPNHDKALSLTSLVLNLFFLFSKLSVAVFSSSLSVTASIVDSAIDLIAVFVVRIFTATENPSDRFPLFKFPPPRTPLQPIAVISVSVIMTAASVQVGLEALKSLLRQYSYENLSSTDSDEEMPDTLVATISVLILIMVIKLILVGFCQYFKTPITAGLSKDHCHDCVTNLVAVMSVVLSWKYWSQLDAIGAIAICVYMCGIWFHTSVVHSTLQPPRPPAAEYVSRLLNVLNNFGNPPLSKVNYCRAYSFGNKFIAEVRITAPFSAHKTGEEIETSVERKLEALSFVERAFVRISFEDEPSEVGSEMNAAGLESSRMMPELIQDADETYSEKVLSIVPPIPALLSIQESEEDNYDH